MLRRSAGTAQSLPRELCGRLAVDPFSYSHAVQCHWIVLGFGRGRLPFEGGWIMGRIRKLAVALLALAALVSAFAPSAARAEKRIALVVGNASYQAGALETPANDAGLIAQTLQAAGFDVVGARDLDQDSLRRAFRDFLEKATSSGPDTVAFVYVSGHGLPHGAE